MTMSNNQIHLRTSNGHYVCAEGGGGREVNATRAAAAAWETFSIEVVSTTAAGTTVHLKAANGQYVCAEGGGGQQVNANRPAAGAWETFTMQGLSGGVVHGGESVHLRTSNGHYVCAEGGGGRAVNATRAAAAAWETFTVELVGARQGQSVADYVRSLAKLPLLPPGIFADPPSSSTTTDQDGSQWTTTTTHKRETRDLGEFTALDTLSSAVFPGALVQGSSLTSSAPAAVNVARNPLNIVVTGFSPAGPGVHVSANVPNPGLGSIQQAISQLLGQAFTGATGANAFVTYSRVFSSEHLAASLGVDISWLTGSVKAAINASYDASQENYVINVTQQYYTVSAEAPSSPASYFAPSVRVEDLTPYSGQGNPLTYVASVTYGRRLVLMCNVAKQKTDINASIEVIAGKIKINSTFNFSSLVQQSRITAFVLGGAAGTSMTLIGTFLGADTGQMQALNTYLTTGANWSAQSPGAPLGYRVNYLSDNTLATAAITTDYTERDYTPLDVMIGGVTLDIHTQDDDKDDSAGINITFYFDNQVVGGANDLGWHVRWPDNTFQSFAFPFSQPVSLAAVLDAAASAPDPDPHNPRGLWMKVTEGHDNPGWRMSYDVTAHLSNGRTQRIGTGGKYVLFDADQPCVFDRMDLGATKPSNQPDGHSYVC